MPNNKLTLFIAGAGYVGTSLAHKLHQQGHHPLALVASQSSLARLHPIRTVQIDLDASELTHCTVDIANTQIIYLVPPNANFDYDIRLARFLNWLPCSPKKIVYASTSGVYGNQHGKLVTEDTALSPVTKRAKRRVNAEQQLLTFCTERTTPLAILRIPGIYGPGRLPLEALKQGRPFIKLEDAYPGNRVHRDDLVQCLVAATTEKAEGIYNICDGNHLSSTQFAIEVARLAALPPPRQLSRDEMKQTTSLRRWSFLSESRRLDNSKILRLLADLDMSLQFDDPINGIRHAIAKTRH